MNRPGRGSLSRPDRRWTRRRLGFSLVEVLVCLGILTFGLLPIVSMYQSTTKKGGLSEFHVFFQARAVRIVEFYASYNFDVFRALIYSSGGGKVNLPIKSQIVDPALPVEYSRKLDDEKYDEICTVEFEDGAEGDLVRMTVDIKWKFPLDDRVHGYTIVRLLCRPDITQGKNELTLTPDAPI